MTITYNQAVERIKVKNLPDFWMVDFLEIQKYLNELKSGEVKLIASSPSGQPVHLVAYGKKEQQPSYANFNSAVGARQPERYKDKSERKKPVIFLLGPVHGHEVESLVGLMNFMNIIETGQDLRGKKHPYLCEIAAKCRLLIIPIANPDGLVRFEPGSLCGMELIDIRFWGQGTWSDNTLCGWPQAKKLHPMKGQLCGFLGGYFNDAGVNIMHDEFLGAIMAEETRAILDTARREAPDLAVSMHSYDAPPGIFYPSYVPLEVKHNIRRLVMRYANLLEKNGLPHIEFDIPEEKGKNPPPFNLTSALYHVSGANSFTYESPHGTVGENSCQVNHGQILDIQLYLYQAMIQHALEMKQNQTNH